MNGGIGYGNEDGKSERLSLGDSLGSVIGIGIGYSDRIFDHPKGLISHKIDTPDSFSKWIKIINKWNIILKEWPT